MRVVLRLSCLRIGSRIDGKLRRKGRPQVHPIGGPITPHTISLALFRPILCANGSTQVLERPRPGLRRLTFTPEADMACSRLLCWCVPQSKGSGVLDNLHRRGIGWYEVGEWSRYGESVVVGELSFLSFPTFRAACFYSAEILRLAEAARETESTSRFHKASTGQTASP